LGVAAPKRIGEAVYSGSRIGAILESLRPLERLPTRCYRGHFRKTRLPRAYTDTAGAQSLLTASASQFTTQGGYTFWHWVSGALGTFTNGGGYRCCRAGVACAWGRNRTGTGLPPRDFRTTAAFTAARSCRAFVVWTLPLPSRDCSRAHGLGRGRQVSTLSLAGQTRRARRPHQGLARYCSHPDVLLFHRL